MDGETNIVVPETSEEQFTTTAEFNTLMELIDSLQERLNTLETIVNELQVQNDIDTAPDTGNEPGTEPIRPIEPEPTEDPPPPPDESGNVRRPNRKHWYFRTVKLW